MVMAAALLAVSANAQVYVGGNLGVASVDDETTYKVLPEIGYSLNDKWAIGTVVGWGKGTSMMDIEKGYEEALIGTFEVDPYVRYTVLNTKYVNVFCDGALGYKHYNGLGNSWSVGLKPGLAVNLNDKFAFVTHVGFLGWKNFEPNHGSSTDSWGVNVDGNNVTFGVYYNF